MTGDQKGKKERLDKRTTKPGGRHSGSLMSSVRLLMEADKVFLLLGAVLQIVLGLGIITVSILGLLQPLWFAALFMVLASANVMVGMWSLYRLISSGQLFDSLINKAIRRAIQSQN